MSTQLHGAEEALFLVYFPNFSARFPGPSEGRVGKFSWFLLSLLLFNSTIRKRGLPLNYFIRIWPFGGRGGNHNH